MTIIYDTSATTITVPYTITSNDASNIIISQPVSQTGYYMCNFFIEFNPNGNTVDNTNYLSAFVCNTNDFNTASSNVNNWYNTVNIYPQYWGTRSCKSCYISTILYLVQGDTISGCFKAFQNQQIISAYLQFMIINIKVIVSNDLSRGAISNTTGGQPFSVFTTSPLTNGIYFFENYLSYSTNQQPYYVFSAISTTNPSTGGFNILNVNNTVNVYTSSTNQTMIRGTHNSSIIDISNNNNVYGIGQTGASNQTLNAGWLNYYLFNNFSIIYTKNENFSPHITIINSDPINVLSYTIQQTGVYYCEGGITYNINTTTNIPLYVCISDISATSSSFTIDSNYSTVNNIYTRVNSNETNFRGCRTTFLLNLNEGDTIYLIGQGAQRNVESYSSSSKLTGISNEILVEASGGINASDASGGYGGVFFIDSSLTLIYGGNGGNGGEASTAFEVEDGTLPPYSGYSSIFGIDTSNIQNSIFPDVSGLTTYDVSNLLYSGCGAGGGGGYETSPSGPTDAGGGFPGGQYSTNSPLSSDQSYNYTAPGLLSGGGNGITATIYGCGGSGCSGVGTPGDSGGSGANGVVVFWFSKVENPVYPIPDPDLINISITANNDQDSKNYLIPLGVSGEFPISYEIIYSIDSLPDEGSLSYKGNQIVKLPYFLDISNNFVTYTPNNNYLGKTDFLYSIYAFINGIAQKPGNQGSCLINISPITQDVSYSTLKNQSVNIEMNPTGLNNYDYLTVFPKLPDYGEIYILNSNNKVNQFQAYNGIDFRYQPGLDYTGKDTFSYYCIKNDDPSYNYTNTSIDEITIDENPVPVPQSKIRCNYKRFNCNNYSKNLPSSSGNIVVPQKTAAMQYARDIRIQTYFKGAKWQLVPEKVNEFGRKAGGPGGYGGPPKNNF